MPDYYLQAKSVKDVQQAVRFASEHNMSLSIITTRHDQLMRSDADSELLLDLSLFQSSHVTASYTATKEGLPLLESDLKASVVTPIEDLQAARAYRGVQG
ncbi:unnamed protein product [Alternaria sp. RS040]